MTIENDDSLFLRTQESYVLCAENTTTTAESSGANNVLMIDGARLAIKTSSHKPSLRVSVSFWRALPYALLADLETNDIIVALSH